MLERTCSDSPGFRAEALEIGIGWVDAPGKGACRETIAKRLVEQGLAQVKGSQLPVRCLLLVSTADWCNETSAVLPRAIREECRKTLGYEVPLIGGSMASLYLLIERNHFLEHGVILVMMCSPDLWVTVSSLETPHDDSEAERRRKVNVMASELQAKAGIRLGASATRHLLAFSPGICLNARGEPVYFDNELHEEILAAFEYRCRVVGCASANGLTPTRGYQFADDRCLESGLALAMLETDLATGTMMGHGFEPVHGAYVTVNQLAGDAESGYEAVTLDGKPAGERLRQLQQHLPRKVSQVFLGLRNGPDHNVVCVLHTDPAGQFVRLSRKVKQGDRLCLLETSARQLADAALTASTVAVAASGAPASTLRLMCDLTCTGRVGLYAQLGRDWKAIAAELKRKFPHVPIVGGLCAGEFGVDRWRRAQANNFTFWVNCMSSAFAPQSVVRRLQRDLLDAGLRLSYCKTPKEVMETALDAAVKAGATGGQVCVVDRLINRIVGREFGSSLSNRGSGHDWAKVAAVTDRPAAKEVGGGFPRYLENWALPTFPPTTTVPEIPPEEDILTLIVRTGRGVFVMDAGDDIFHCDKRAAAAGEIVTFLAIPLIGSQGMAIATLQLSFEDRKPMDQESQGLWVGFAQKVAAALERTEEAEERETAERISNLGNRFLLTSQSEAHLDDWCAAYLEDVVKILGADGAHLRLLDESSGGEAYRLVAAVGSLAEIRGRTRPVTRPGDGSCSLHLLQCGGCITNTKEETRLLNKSVKAILEAAALGQAFAEELDTYEATAMLPVTYDEKIHGSFVVDSKRKYFFTERRARLTRAAAALGGAILRGKRQAYALGVRMAATEAELQKNQQLRDAFEDVAHQIKSPLMQAARHLETLTQRGRGVDQNDLGQVLTLLRRAEVTSKLIGIFANLAKGEELTITREPLVPAELIMLAGEVCENHRHKVSPKRNVKIHIDLDSFRKHAPSKVDADRELLIQALSNLVDNGVRYSYPNTEVQVYCGGLPDGQFFIGVTNKGIPISSEEVEFVTRRNWRGKAAKKFAGEGNGVGLWIVRHIMKAHNGELQVLPTRPEDGITEIRLAFPPPKPRA